ncbi:radical SAM family protein [Rhodospirillum rubrum F11]|uniref:Pyruvate formate-lyase-activating enzyme n=2 Tax=Rhodospirillum rubrum TaxID=1085 RepID=Q2RQ01_RHORT|nr:pyruvate formate-lyase-activating protein [Rhodospirillum rubrum]ABC23794.1 Radical SAM [Rhodospirillum rubrum ATCC 11170]AEO49534.1 radical SAM family protein [Rhodospirillum rubrum F11]MBK5955471.1 pyruvate formate-lyase 1-activating enzyme [Rhodospirillum rubrum]QXG79743.1 pyruvate formate lyase-activating protein [Rhodospirillum rubrum]
MFDLPAPLPQVPAEADLVSPPLQTRGFLHSVETGAAVDGPGMRFVFFLSGCQFRCAYCHNPDTWKLHNGRALDLDEAMAEVSPYAGFLRIAGGVTVSGGEPLMQADFTGALLARLKDQLGLHTALDTQGFLHAGVSDRWFDPVDLVLLDIKHSDPEAYHRLTGQALAPTLAFAHRLVDLGKPMWIRYVLVPGLTDGADDIDRLADFLACLGPAVQRVEVLPFHQMGAAKWARLGLTYSLAQTPTPTAPQVDAARARFAERGLKVF